MGEIAKHPRAKEPLADALGFPGEALRDHRRGIASILVEWRRIVASADGSRDALSDGILSRSSIPPELRAAQCAHVAIIARVGNRGARG